jgi:hypothetical protein
VCRILHNHYQQQHNHIHNSDLHDLPCAVERDDVGGSQFQLRSVMRLCRSNNPRHRDLRTACPAVPVHNDHDNNDQHDNDNHDDDIQPSSRDSAEFFVIHARI